MTDPLSFWYGNTEVVERLTQFLSLRDVCRCSQLSRRWREALDVDHVWWRLAGRLEGCREMFGSVRLREETGPLGGRCSWGQHLALCQGVRRRWRTGGETTLTPHIPHPLTSHLVTCYDCHGELLVLGTDKSYLLSYNLSSDSRPEVARAVVSRRMDKVYTRHGLVIAMQGGLVQVLTSSLRLLYCKSLELPDLQLHLQPGDGDELYVPQLTVEELRRSYRPGREVTLSQYDLTISTTGTPKMWVARTGETGASCYGLQSGLLEERLELEEGDRMFKLGLVQQAEYSSYLYILVHDEQRRTVGTMYHTERGTFLWRLELTNVLSYEHNVFSVYTSKGLLMFGRLQGDTDYPFTWAWRGWKYDGEEFYRNNFETEFDMSLTDWTTEAIVTPRAMSSLFTGEEFLAFTQRSHRGSSTFVYRWGGPGEHRKMWKSSCPADLRHHSGIKLVGSEVGGVVVTSHGDLLQVRDITTGIKTRDIRLTNNVDVMWCDEYKIVTLSRTLDCEAPVTVLKMT